MEEVKPGKYRHFKGKTIEVIGTGKHSETLEEMVVYKEEDGNIWIRPKRMFLEKMKVGGKETQRFEFLEK